MDDKEIKKDEVVSEPKSVENTSATPKGKTKPNFLFIKIKKLDEVTETIVVGCIALLIAITYLFHLGFSSNKYDKKLNNNDNNVDIQEKEDKEEEEITTSEGEDKKEEEKTEEKEEEQPKEKKDEEEEVVKICTEKKTSSKNNELSDFDISFMKLESEEKNLVYSPLSIKYGLKMLSEGANGETKTQIDNVLGKYESTKYINGKHVSVANALFVNTKWKDNIKSSYTQKLSSKYDAEVIMDSFETDAKMRKWVKEKTQGLIDSPIPVKNDNNEEYMYSLVNALAIDMNWNYQLQISLDATDVPGIQYWVDYPHEDYKTSIEPICKLTPYPKMTFNGKANRKSTLIGATINKYDVIKELGEEQAKQLITDAYNKFVEEKGKEYLEKNHCNSLEESINEHLSNVKKNYGDVKLSTDFYIYDDNEIKVFAKDLKKYDCLNLQYVAIMPKKTTINNYVKSLTAAELNNNIKKLKDIKLENFEEGYITKITGNIPLFSFDSSIDLTKDLKQLNINNVFDKDKSDLSNLADIPSYIENAIHEATIDFSNEGIRAGAIIEADGGAGATMYACLDYKFQIPVKTIDITFDKPFMFIIRDKDTNEIWFAGKVYDVMEQK